MTSAQIKADLAVPFYDFPLEEIIVDGVTYQALMLERINGSDWTEGGEVPVKSLRFAVKRSDIGSLPDQGDEASFAGSSYYVGQVDSGASEENVVIELVHTTQA